MAKGPQPGDAAPDFELEGTEGSFRLSEHRGRNVVLLFYPMDNSLVCTRQMCSYRDAGERMDSLDAVVVGISPQGLDSHAAFTAKHQLNVPLLADTDKAVTGLYAMKGPLGSKRGVIIVDAEGKVAFRHDHLIGIDYLTVDQLGEALSKIPSAA